MMLNQCALQWDTCRHPAPSAYDMYWISPSNLESHVDMTSHLGSSGFGMAIKAIIFVSDCHIPHSTVYPLTYLLVSYCNKQCFHMHNDDSLKVGVWRVIFPSF